MKKGKVFGKSQIMVAVMVVALGAAIWLNAKYLPSSSKYLGEASYVSNTSSTQSAVATSAKVDTKDYFATAKQEREKSYKNISETVEETLKNGKATDSERESALEKLNELAARMEKENNIETLLKAKGFSKAVAVIGDKGISIIVDSEGLTTAKTLQIQDVVTTETDISLSAIKIVPIAE